MRSRVALILIVLLTVPVLFAGDEAKAKSVTLRGEIVDLHCNSSRDASGEKHSGCAEACIGRGVPAGLVVENGDVYLLIDEKMTSIKDRVAGKVGKPVMVVGTLSEVGGLKILKVTSIE